MKEGLKEACYYLLKPFSLVLSSVILCFLQDKGANMYHLSYCQTVMYHGGTWYMSYEGPHPQAVPLGSGPL